MNAIEWVAVKKGFVCYVGDDAIGAIFKHRKGSWVSWVLTASKELEGSTGHANGVDAAKSALETKWTEEQGN